MGIAGLVPERQSTDAPYPEICRTCSIENVGESGDDRIVIYLLIVRQTRVRGRQRFRRWSCTSSWTPFQLICGRPIDSLGVHVHGLSTIKFAHLSSPSVWLTIVPKRSDASLSCSFLNFKLAFTYQLLKLVQRDIHSMAANKEATTMGATILHTEHSLTTHSPINRPRWYNWRVITSCMCTLSMSCNFYWYFYRSDCRTHFRLVRLRQCVCITSYLFAVVYCQISGVRRRSGIFGISIIVPRFWLIYTNSKTSSAPEP